MLTDDCLLMFRVMIVCRSSRHPRWLSVHPSRPFLVDRKPSASSRADVDLPAADGATSGFCPQRLGRETRGGLGWRSGVARLAGSAQAGCVVHPNSPPRASAVATDRATSGTTIPIFHRLLLWDDRPAHDSVTKFAVASSQSPRRTSVTIPSAMSLWVAAKLLVHCQNPSRH